MSGCDLATSAGLDEQIRKLLADFERERIPPTHTLSVDEARRLSREMVKRFAVSPPALALVKDTIAPIGDARLPVRVYVPKNHKNLPVLIYFHGGGWVVGDLDNADWVCRSLALGAGCLVFSVDYRLAPEHKFPIAVADCYSTTRWIAESGFEEFADKKRLAVGGDSAGGNLAAATCLMARNRGGPSICYQLLIYPVMNYSFDTGSYRSYADGYLLTMKEMQWYWNHYLRNPADGANPYASPLLGDLRSLPPALVLTAEFDPLRDEGEAYARRLRDAGVPARISRYSAVTHGFMDFPHLTKTTAAIEESATELRKALAA